MEQIVIRNLPEGTVEAEARAILTEGLAGENMPMSVLLAAD
ncbi:antitoxin, partial [Mycobacterium intracellulare subsp. chimaera]